MKRRRAIVWLIGGTLAAGALVAVAVALRMPLAERVVLAYLAQRGFPQAAVSVSRLGLDRAIIDDLTLGPALPAIGRIELRYRPVELLGLNLRQIRVEGLRAILDIQDAEALARLKRLLPAGGGGGAPGPAVELADAQVVVRAPGLAGITVTFGGTLDLARSPARASFAGRAQGEFGEVSLSAWAEDPLGRPTLQIVGEAEADLGRLPWPAGLGPRPRSGTAQLSLSGSLPTPAADEPLIAGLLAGQGSLVLDLDVRAAALPPYATAIDARASLTVRTGGGTLALTMEEPAVLTARGAAADAIEASLLADAVWTPGDPIPWRLHLKEGALRMPGRDLAAERIAATLAWPLAQGGEPAMVSAALSMPSGRLAPLLIDGNVTAGDDAFLFEGAIATPGGEASIPLTARWLSPDARGGVTLGPATLAFRPGAFQPAALGSALAKVTRAEGAIEVAATFDFAPDAPLAGTAGVTFGGLTLATQEGVIEKLAGTLKLDGLFPPHAAGAQTVSAARLLAGLPLEAPSVRFRLEPGETGSALVIERAQGQIAGGTVSIEGARFDPSLARNAFTIAIDGLSLERLLADYAMEGLSGTGTLSGAIPVIVSATGVAIESGVVRAGGGGVLKVAWGGSRDALIGQGEPVSLMVRTLEDFRYSALGLTIERPADGSLALTVALDGHNPAVKDGYPFRFNISFTGDLEEILAAVREGRRLGTDLFRGSLGGGP